MTFKAGLFFITFLVGSIAFPLNEDNPMSYFLDNPVDALIVGGTVAAEPVPYMVALTTGFIIKSHFCGGSIVNKRFVLSATHCIREVQNGPTVIKSLRGIVGNNRWSSSDIEHTFSHGIMHPDYDHFKIKNDIGFLVSTSDFVFTENVQPVVLNFDFIGGNAATIANGWGRLRTGGNSPRDLMELRPTTVDGEQCVADVIQIGIQQNRPVPSVHPEIELCAFFRPNTGMCHGDSGSALVLEESKEQVGIVSWSIPCAQGSPDIYARISAYKSWIEQQLR